MFQRLIFLLMLSIISQFTEAQSDLTHYYIKMDGSNHSNIEFEYGKIIYDEKYYPKRMIDPTITSKESMIQRLFTTLSEVNTSDKLNILIHGLWADKKFAWEKMIQNISRDTYENDDNKQKVILSIIWDSSYDYAKGVRIARIKGDFLSGFLKELLNKNELKYKVNFLCHSMGNRVFQHMINESDLIDKKQKLIDQFVSIGADIESNTFEEGQPLYGLENLVNDITIYVHNNDRTLGMSTLLNSSKRLGLEGVPDISSLPDNYRIIDVSTITDHDDITSKIGNHRYFYTSPTVRKDLQRVLWEKDFVTSKKELDHPRRLKLIQEEEVKQN